MERGFFVFEIELPSLPLIFIWRRFASVALGFQVLAIVLCPTFCEYLVSIFKVYLGPAVKKLDPKA